MTSHSRSNDELNIELGQLKSKLNNLWGPFSFVLSPIFDTMNPITKPKGSTKLKNMKKSLTIVTEDDITLSKLNIKKVSPKSSLTDCEEKLVLESLVRKINEILAKNHHDFNPIAQSTPFWLKKKPTGLMEDYLTYLCFTTLAGNMYVLAEAIRIFENVVKKKSEIIHENTVHRIIGCCCLLAGKLCYDGYNSKGFEKVLGVRRSKMSEMENM